MPGGNPLKYFIRKIIKLLRFSFSAFSILILFRSCLILTDMNNNCILRCDEMNVFAFRNREVFYMNVTDVCRIAVEVDDDGVKKVGRICFVVDLFHFLLNDTLNHVGVLQFDSDCCGNLLTGYQCLEIQSHQLFFNWIIVNVLYQGINFFAFDVQVNLCTFFICFYAISIALMPSGELFTTELNLFPKNPTFSNFINAFRTVPLLRFILNSFIMAGCITIGQIITCSLAAFAFSFLEFKGKGILFMVVMATMMVPGEATIISNYLTVSGWGMLDTYQVLIVPYLTSAMGIFLFRQFYMTFPISLYESAKLDGCSNLKFIVRILLPLTKSAIGAMAVYTFINAWNMYMWPLLVTGSNNMRTVQIGISMLDSVDSQSITLMIAGVVMIIIPSISIFIIGQKQLIRGMFSGAVKG